jgi:SAM-dependent methyltransferase
MIAEARELLKKSKKPMKVTDLGCGSGALLLPLAQEFPEHEFIGLEWDIVPLTMGKIKAKLAGLKNIKFVKGNYMKDSHADMDIIMCYVLKVTGEPLGKKLAAEIKDTAVVISEMFPLAHLEEVKQIQSSLAGIPEKIFVYRKPIVANKKVKNQDKKTVTKTKVNNSKITKRPAAKTKTTNKTQKKGA